MRRVVPGWLLSVAWLGLACVACAQQPIGDVYQSGSGANGAGAETPAQAVQNLYKISATITDDPSSGYDAKTDHWPEADSAWQQWDNATALNGSAVEQQQRTELAPCAAHLGNAIDSAERGYRIQISQKGNAAAQKSAQQDYAAARNEFAQCNLTAALDGSNGNSAAGGTSAGSGPGAPIRGGVSTGTNGTPGTSGTNQTNGTNQKSGTNGTSGTSGTSQRSGAPGTNGGGPGTPTGTKPGTNSPPAKQQSNPVANAGDYLHGVMDGFGNCFKGMGSLLAGAGYFAQGDFQNAATAWGLEPGQSVVLKTMYSELTTPSVGSNVLPYDAGVTAGRRLCAYAVVPGVTKAAGTLIKGAVSPGSTFTNPIKGSALQDAIDGEVPKSGVASEAPQPNTIANKWVQTGNGPVQLGKYAGQGSFATVFKYGKSSVIKFSRSNPGILGYGPESIEGQSIGASRLEQAGVETPNTSNYNPGGSGTPASIMAEDVTQKYPGSYPLSAAKFQTLNATQQAQVLNAVTNAANQIAKSGDVLIDVNPGNFTMDPLGNALKAIIHDPDMVMTVPEIQELASNSIRRAVLDGALELAGEPNFLKQAFTAQSLTEVLNIAREKMITGVRNVPSGTVPVAK